MKSHYTRLLGIAIMGLLWLLTSHPAAAITTGGPLFIENIGQYRAGSAFQLWPAAMPTTVTDTGIVWRIEDAPVTLTLPATGTPAPQQARATTVSYWRGDAAFAAVPVWGAVQFEAAGGGQITVTADGAGVALHASERQRAPQPLKISGADAVDWRGRQIRIRHGERVWWVSADPADFTVAGVPSPTRWQQAYWAVRHGWLHAAAGESAPQPGAATPYATLLGGSGYDELRALAVDAAGAAYVTGFTEIGDFPTTPGAFDTTHGGVIDAFVAKLAPDGGSLAYATFIGGAEEDRGYDIHVNAAGEATVVGWTKSADFPTTPGAYQPALAGNWDAYILQLSAAGDALNYSTYLGGSGVDRAVAVAVDTAGDPVVAGWTKSADFPTTPGAFDPTYSGDWDLFITRLAPGGGALAHSTYLGGADGDLVRDIAVAADGQLVAAGYTSSADFPTTAGAFDVTANGGSDGFAVRLDASLASLVYATYIGGAADERLEGLALSADGRVTLAGSSASPDFPTTPDAYAPTLAGGEDAVALRLNAAGTALEWSTFFGGVRSDRAYAVALDGEAPLIVGETKSDDFPVTSRAASTQRSGNYDAFAVRLAADGTGIAYGAYLGGSGFERGYAIAGATAGTVVVAGNTDAADFPATAGAFDATLNGYDDGFVSRVNTLAPAYTLYVSFDTDGMVGGVDYAAEDILAFDSSSATWSLYFDGSDVGLADANVNALFFYLGDPVLSFDAATDVPGLAAPAQASDLVIFFPTSTGDNTAGTFAWALDASDVNIDDAQSTMVAALVTADGRLAAAFGPYATLDGVSFRQEDLLAFNAISFGGGSAGSWELYFDGTDVELGSVPEQLTGAAADRQTGDLYLTVNDAFTVDGASGGAADIFVCRPIALGNATDCAFRVFWRGGDFGVGDRIDAFDIRWESTAAGPPLSGWDNTGPNPIDRAPGGAGE